MHTQKHWLKVHYFFDSLTFLRHQSLQWLWVHRRSKSHAYEMIFPWYSLYEKDRPESKPGVNTLNFTGVSWASDMDPGYVAKAQNVLYLSSCIISVIHSTGFFVDINKQNLHNL